MLKTAFQAEFRKMIRARMASRSAYWLKLQRDLDAREGGLAKRAIASARRAVENGERHYPALIRSMHRESESDGLRYVGRVVPDTPRRDIWASRENCGWHTDPHGEVFKDGTGLCFGVVYQLPGRKGESRFVAGYEFGGVDGGPTLDLSRVFVEPRGEYSASPRDLDAARDAARHADGLAKAAAETEREYQTAWLAGSDYAQEGESIAEARRDLLGILKECRALKGTSAPALCAAIRSHVQDLLHTIQKARAKRAKLAQGDSPDLYFWPCDERLRAAFCEGAGIDRFPA